MGTLSTECRLLTQRVEEQAAELARLCAEVARLRQEGATLAEHVARLRAKVGRLIAVWPTCDMDNSMPADETEGAIYREGEGWAVIGRGLARLTFLTREAAVRAAAGLDAGDATTAATHGEGEGR